VCRADVDAAFSRSPAILRLRVPADAPGSATTASENLRNVKFAAEGRAHVVANDAHYDHENRIREAAPDPDNPKH